jgi:hypothetical protein
MNKIIAIVMLLAMVLSLCACSNAKIRTEGAAIRAVKKDRGTDSYICINLGIGAMDRIQYHPCSAEQTEGGWRVTLEGNVHGTLNRTGLKSTILFRFTCTISEDRTITDRNVVKIA